MTTLTNRAAVLPTPKAHPLTVTSVSVPDVGPNTVLIRVRAVALNPCDVAIQSMAIIWKDYPLVHGSDLAGEVVAVGTQAAKKFAVGDRVCACAERGAFAELCAADALLVAKIPDHVPYSHAAVLPLCLSTAASSLFEKGNMELRHPQKSLPIEPNGMVVVVWGAASSVGSCAVQLLKAAGYRVAATAGEKNQGYCRELGADWVFDYRAEGVVEQIIDTLKGQGESAGVFSAILAGDVVRNCAVIADRLGGAKVVGTVVPSRMPLHADLPEGVRLGVCDTSAVILPDSIIREPLGIPKPEVPSEVPAAVWDSWLSWALDNGTLKCKPDPKVVGTGLESIQHAIDVMAKGVSASKIVVDMN